MADRIAEGFPRPITGGKRPALNPERGQIKTPSDALPENYPYKPFEGIDGKTIELTGIPSIDTSNKSRDERARLEAAAFIDPLTGCYNQNFLNHYLKEKFDPRREDRQLSAIYFDVNGLKPINDNLGHDAGDSLIRHAAGYIKDIFRDEDLVIHLHGDEFLVVCKNNKNDPNFSKSFPLIIRERIISTTPSGFIFNDQYVDYSIAAGVAVFNREKDGDDFNKTIARADKRMYLTKKAMT